MCVCASVQLWHEGRARGRFRGERERVVSPWMVGPSMDHMTLGATFGMRFANGGDEAIIAMTSQVWRWVASFGMTTPAVGDTDTHTHSAV